jgi:hypothetical protein
VSVGAWMYGWVAIYALVRNLRPMWGVWIAAGGVDVSAWPAVRCGGVARSRLDEDAEGVTGRIGVDSYRLLRIVVLIPQ